MPTPNNTINLGPTRNLKLRAVQIERGPTLRQQAPQPPRMRLEINKVDGQPALIVTQYCEQLFTIYAEKDGRVWGGAVIWYPRADGKRTPFNVGMRDFEARLLLQRLLAGLDFSAARKAREAVAP